MGLAWQFGRRIDYARSSARDDTPPKRRRRKGVAKLMRSYPLPFKLSYDAKQTRRISAAGIEVCKGLPNKLKLRFYLMHPNSQRFSPSCGQYESRLDYPMLCGPLN